MHGKNIKKKQSLLIILRNVFQKGKNTRIPATSKNPKITWIQK